MIDKTTAGMTAAPEEVEAVLHNLCGYHLAERDPVFRYTVLTREQVLYDALVAAIKRERGRALAELVASGTTLTHAAQMTNLASRQQVQRLIAIARAAEAAAAEIQAASREADEGNVGGADRRNNVGGADQRQTFEDRMDAVEATLDEVLNGVVAPAPPLWIRSGGPASGPEAESLALEVSPVDSSDGALVAAAEADPVEVPVGSVEQTQILSALAAVIHPTREAMPAEDTKWWRRGRDSGAA